MLFKRTKLLKDGGIEFIQNFEVGKDPLEQLRKNMMQSIATGVYKPREIELPGNDRKHFSCNGIFNSF